MAKFYGKKKDDRDGIVFTIKVSKGIQPIRNQWIVMKTGGVMKIIHKTMKSNHMKGCGSYDWYKIRCKFVNDFDPRSSSTCNGVGWIDGIECEVWGQVNRNNLHNLSKNNKIVASDQHSSPIYY